MARIARAPNLSLKRGLSPPTCLGMSLRSFFRSLPLPLLLATIAVAQTPSPTPAPAGAIDEKLFRGMQWRQVGPFRGGRALAIEGISNEPGVYYFGAVAGGIWKTTDGGANWAPLFDKETISSIGAIAVAPRSEEHTSELQSLAYLVCRLLLEKKK